MRQHSREYTEYLKSEAWNERRQARLQKANYRCERCGEKSKLDVHHKTYDRLGDEPLSDLIALCQSCHWAADEERRGNNVPKMKLCEPIPEQEIKRREMTPKQRKAVFMRERYGPKM